jgi:hypothetical protein
MVAASSAADAITFSGLIDNLDVQKNTKLHVREYWKSVQNQEVTWSGEVYDVQGGAKSRVKILIADKLRPTYKGYNIVLTTTDVAKAADIKRGQKIKFKGILHDYSAKRAGATVDLTEGQLL